MVDYHYCSICGQELQAREDKHLACTRCPFVNYQNPRPTVTALLLHQNRLLLTRRQNAPFKDCWDLPGGFLDWDEHPAEALKRELREETGLDIEVKKIFGIYPGTYPDEFDPCRILSIVYLAESKTDLLRPNSDVVEAKWVARDELPAEIAFDSNHKIIKDFIKTWK